MLNHENLDKVIVGLMVMAVSWLFIQSLRVNPVEQGLNKLSVSVDNLNTTLYDMQSNNAKEHSELAQMIYGQKTKMLVNLNRLEHVEYKCEENHQDIKDCREVHNGKSSF